MNGRVRAISVVAAAVVAVVGLSVTGASAHTAPIEVNCESGMNIPLSDYEPAGTNTIKVWIDGVLRVNRTYGGTSNVSESMGDPYVTHTYRVVVEAWDDPTGSRGWSYDTGERNFPKCAEHTTTTTSAATTTTSAPAATTTTTTATTVASTVITPPPASGGPTTTAIVASAGATTTTTTLVGSLGALPVTGGSSSQMTAISVGLVALGFGILLIVATRRNVS